MTDIDKDLDVFNEAVRRFKHKAETCTIKGIVENIKFAEYMSNKLYSNLQLMNDKQKERHISMVSHYISYQGQLNECICKKP